MATSNNTIKTRIQLKSDTEANWNKAGPKDGSLGFIPLRGELIIYSADETHAFSRLKVGDGSTNVTALPFIDAGTLNGTEVEVQKYATRENFPIHGHSDKLYIALDTLYLYYYDTTLGYQQLSPVTLNTTTSLIGNVMGWSRGATTGLRIENNTLKLIPGILPELHWDERAVISEVSMG